MKLKPIQDQVIVILGASSGIGRETALEAARRGARVVVAARSEEGLASLVDEIQAGGGQAMAAVADVASFEQVQAVAGQAVASFGGIDTWVNVAGTSLYAPFDRTTPEEFHRIIEVNLLGQVYGDMAALPYLKQAGQGALIHVTSIEARTPVPLHSAYNTSKHGLDGLIDSMRMELEHEGLPISVTNILPASINTPFFEKSRTKLGVQPRGIPPVYEPHVVAEAILYAAEHPTREIAAGGAGRMLLFLRRWSPGLVTAAVQRIAYRAQRSTIRKSADAPNNLFHPAPGYDRVEGNMERSRTSVYTWLRVYPAARLAAAGLALGIVAGGLIASGALSRPTQNHKGQKGHKGRNRAVGLLRPAENRKGLKRPGRPKLLHRAREAAGRAARSDATRSVGRGYELRAAAYRLQAALYGVQCGVQALFRGD